MKAPDAWFQKYFACYGDLFDPKSFDMCITHVKRDGIAIDCGAHVGSWTKALSNVFSKVYAFEPNPVNYEYLLENINGIQNIITSRFALGDADEEVAIKQGTENSGQSHVVSGSGVEMRRLCDVIPIEDHSNVTFIKMDIEGFELQALRGAKSLIESSHPHIMVELNGLSNRYGHTDNDVIDYLNRLGYYEIARENKDYLFSHGK